MLHNLRKWPHKILPLLHSHTAITCLHGRHVLLNLGHSQNGRETMLTWYSASEFLLLTLKPWESSLMKLSSVSCAFCLSFPRCLTSHKGRLISDEGSSTEYIRTFSLTYLNAIVKGNQSTQNLLLWMNRHIMELAINRNISHSENV